MADPRKRRNRQLIQQKDGSYLFTYRKQRYALRLRRHVETDTWDVASIWSEAYQQYVPVCASRYENRWEALLAGELHRSVEEALRATQRIVADWLEQDEGTQYGLEVGRAPDSARVEGRTR